ncbi:hypothetical protein N7493_011500 [Penicillium malachiteum]|uniref:Helicase C-terminal domain-containing protein n=1 Tax=Penicillium malachiteum TaxID=1324776 RepID=A0AAD6HAS9_9EURO|nr:hypothetical protein N7493_011500 [Penicillium malachiteum]
MEWEPGESTSDAACDAQKEGNIIKENGARLLSSNPTQSIPGPEIPDISDEVPPSHDIANTGISMSAVTTGDELEESPRIWLPVGVFDKHLIFEGYSKTEITLLSAKNWIRTHTNETSPNVRIYIQTSMTDRRNSQRSITKLRNALKTIMSRLDSSPEAWAGTRTAVRQELNMTNGAEDESLWYIFNTLNNPDPDPEIVEDIWSRDAMDELLSGDDLSYYGLKTRLYPYQCRSAAMMIQRETQPARMLDPRLQAWQTPTGVEYYYDKEDGCVVRDKVMYSEACGGILAETMGCGKTLITLAVIWATCGHFPKIPVEYLSSPDRPNTIPVREKVGSLMDMAAAAAGRHSQPWKHFFSAKKRHGRFYERCIKACEMNSGSYEIPQHQTRYQGRHSVSFPRPPPKLIRLCSGTLVIVPNNLVDHWQREIANHTEGLKVLILRQGADKTPSADQLFDYDIVLFSKTRFEREAGEPVHNRREKLATVESPLTELHWLRVVVDEGHNVAGNGSRTNMIHLLKQLHFERRWVISGTPSTGLYGVEVSLASQEAATSDTETSEQMTAAVLKGRRKTGNAVENELKDLDRMRRIVIDFLDLKPWSNSRADDPADWTKYIKPYGEDGKRRKTPAIRATLQGLVVRHRLDVINKEITLPKLYNKVVYLKPTFYDRLSINLFLFSLAVNAITSEREGTDYMFHSSNRKHLNQTINNLRQAGFWWVGSDVKVEDTVDSALKYLEKNREKMTSADVEQLNKGIAVARKASESGTWQEFKQLHELGVFVLNFPDAYRSHWGIDPSNTDNNPLLVGITQACRAQQFVTENLRLSDPTQGFAGRGIKVRSELVRRDQSQTRGAPESANTPVTPGQLNHSPKPSNIKSPKKTFDQKVFRTLPDESPLKNTQFVATASAKLTYLLDQVLELHTSEKIIIFYDNNNSAYWIAEGLELLGIEFRIYASTLKPELRTEYLKLFREADEVRVLLMDLRQASHGLHIAQASRVFIVNPIWQPNVESQAIKRAHRIGQTRPVYVETLVLEGTLEDRMLRRRKEMSEAEMQHAEKSLLDDTAMSDIIQNEDFLEMTDENASGAAYLRHPTGFFDRHRLPIPDDEVDASMTGNKNGKRTRSIPFPIVESGADSDGSPAARASIKTRFDLPESPTPKKPRIGFAASVQVFGNGTDESDSGDRMRSSGDEAPSSRSPISPLSEDGGKQTEKRVSIFGP